MVALVLLVVVEVVVVAGVAIAVVVAGADLTGGHSCMADEAPGRLGLGGPRRPGKLNFGLQLQFIWCIL